MVKLAQPEQLYKQSDFKKFVQDSLYRNHELDVAKAFDILDPVKRGKAGKDLLFQNKMLTRLEGEDNIAHALRYANTFRGRTAAAAGVGLVGIGALTYGAHRGIKALRKRRHKGALTVGRHLN